MNPYVYHPGEIPSWLLKNDQDNSNAVPVGEVLACRSDSVSVSGTVLGNGNTLSLTFDGTGCFSPVAAAVLQRTAGSSKSVLAPRSIHSSAARSKGTTPKPRAVTAAP